MKRGGGVGDRWDDGEGQRRRWVNGQRIGYEMVDAMMGRAR